MESQMGPRLEMRPSLRQEQQLDRTPKLTFLKDNEFKVKLSRDKKQILHIMSDGRAIGRPVDYYRAILFQLGDEGK